jgi:flagellar hook assembly protein FlgD
MVWGIMGDRKVRFLDMKRNNVIILMGALLFCTMPFFVFGGGAQEVPPTVSFDGEDVVYLSPAVSPGTQDNIEIPLTIQAGEKMVIKEYIITVSDESGNTVKIYAGKDESADPTFFQRLAIRLGRREKETTVEIPDKIAWDGTDDSGNYVDDGSYSYILEAIDDAGLSSKTESKSIVIDNTPPYLEVSIPEGFAVFGVGKKTKLQVTQSNGTIEDSWVSVLTDESGNEVIRHEWNNQTPVSFTWDVNAEVYPLEDGVYTYTVSTVDRAGTAFAIEPITIEKDTKTRPLELSVDDNLYISPNGDGINDFLTFSFGAGLNTKGLQGGTLTILNKKGNVVKTYNTSTEPPKTVVVDGYNDDGTVFEDGEYRAWTRAEYANGDRPEAFFKWFVVDNAPPAASVAASETIFSPNNDGRKDSVNITHEASNEDLWRGEVTLPDGTSHLVAAWTGAPIREVVWDGRDLDGNELPDGTYSYRIYAEDMAGNFGESNIIAVNKDTRAKDVYLEYDLTYFSPNGDGKKDRITITPVLSLEETPLKYDFYIVDAYGSIVYNRRITGKDPETVIWDGKTDGGVQVQDGEYSAFIELLYENGNAPQAVSDPFFIDTTISALAVTADPTEFSPDGDGEKDIVSIMHEFQAEGDEVWKGEFKDASGRAVKTLFWDEAPPDRIIWDGFNDGGNTLRDGRYTYSLSVSDRADNIGVSNAAEINIDTSIADLKLTVREKMFSPNGDGKMDTVTIEPILSIKTGIVSYILTIRDKNGRAVKTYSGKETAPRTVVWDGKNETGKYIPDGTYYGELEVSYVNGTKPIAQSDSFISDTAAGEVFLEIEYASFSPEGNGNRDTIDIYPELSGGNGVASYNLQIKDSAGEEVLAIPRQAKKLTSYTWDGKDRNGKTVSDGEYRAEIQVSFTNGSVSFGRSKEFSVDTRRPGYRIGVVEERFSPNRDGFFDTVEFVLYGKEDIFPVEWEAFIEDSASGERTTLLSGTGSNIPMTSRMVWDGTDYGAAFPDGSYRPGIWLVYESGKDAQFLSEKSVIIDTRGPDLEVLLSPDIFSPDGDGMGEVLTVDWTAYDESGLGSWELMVLDDNGKYFNGISGTGDKAPPAPLRWNGRSARGELVASAENYSFEYIVYDALHNPSMGSDSIRVDIFTDFIDGKHKMRVRDVYFAPFTDDYRDSVKPGIARSNIRTIKNVADLLKKFPEYGILLDGHAVSLHWYDEAKARIEHLDVLIPLSLQRAEQIRLTLIRAGIDPANIFQKGYGGAVPIVPHEDEENRWINRRVEFYLLK